MNVSADAGGKRVDGIARTIACQGEVLDLVAIIVEVVGVDDGHRVLFGGITYADVVVSINRHLAGRVDVVVVAL